MAMLSIASIAAINDEIAIRWEDGAEHYFRMDLLRAASPSAEQTGERDLLGRLYGGSMQTEFPGVRVLGWQPVGGYALLFQFSDGHATGIYAFDYLRRLGEALAGSEV